MAFSATVIQDGNKHVVVRLNNDNSSAVVSTKILDTSTLSFSDGGPSQILRLVKIKNISDNGTDIAGKIQFSNNLGVASGTKSLVVASSVYTIDFIITNNVANSNGDVFFESAKAAYLTELTFEKISGFSSTKPKWNS